MIKKLMIFCLALAVAAMSLPARADRMAYRNEILGDGALSLWEFEDPASNNGAPCADATGGSPGIYRNTGTGPDIWLLPSDWEIQLGVYFGGQMAQFPGTTGGGGAFVQIPDSSNRLQSSPSCSLELLMKCDTTAEETYGRLYSHADGTTTNYWLGIPTTGSTPGQPFVGVPGATWYAWPPILADANWHHVVVTYAYAAGPGETTTTLYIDNVNRGSRTDPGALAPGGPDLLLGAEGNQFYVYNGYPGILDEVSYFDYTLTPGDVEAHYDAIFVPEPATIALLGLGGLLLRRRER